MTSSLHAERPWGRYTVLASGDGYQVKVITVSPGKRLSYQRHQHRSEHWYIVSGIGRVVLDGRDIDVAAGEAVDVPVGSAHRIGSSGDEPVVFIEVQLGNYLGEDDIVRIDDDFGRAPGPASGAE